MFLHFDKKCEFNPKLSDIEFRQHFEQKKKKRAGNTINWIFQVCHSTCASQYLYLYIYIKKCYNSYTKPQSPISSRSEQKEGLEKWQDKSILRSSFLYLRIVLGRKEVAVESTCSQERGKDGFFSFCAFCALSCEFCFFLIHSLSVSSSVSDHSTGCSRPLCWAYSITAL